MSGRAEKCTVARLVYSVQKRVKAVHGARGGGGVTVCITTRRRVDVYVLEVVVIVVQRAEQQRGWGLLKTVGVSGEDNGKPWYNSKAIEIWLTASCNCTTTLCNGTTLRTVWYRIQI